MFIIDDIIGGLLGGGGGGGLLGMPSSFEVKVTQVKDVEVEWVKEAGPL